ncbi:isoliquiritigenin 2'-O-methyltransferase-like protein [Trifolium pratense]|uniref:Isoliquiritigenin 2'-O-methyltransferase-like protein n=2 Tax=Trifolium pratense TaxID=57577 RepID=A0A2K3L895_TRIPR|nr:isoliquiritigenin 2'-O-methyltransferase-like protein [Trifolium pratense]
MGSICEDIHDIPKFLPFVAEDDDDACLSAMLLCCGPMIYTSVLKAAIELNLFEIISKANPPCVSASYVASKLSTTQHPQLPRRLDRMLCLLASHSLLVCSTRTNEEGGNERFYELSLAGKYFVKDEKNGSVALFSSFMNHQKFMDAFNNFKEVLSDCENGLYMNVHGMPVYQGIQSDPAWNHVFNKSMADICTIEMKKILEKYKGFEGISMLVDVGGGIGQSLNMIISKYPSIKGINFDLPQVIQHAPIYPGIEHVEGDMFKSVPKADAIILKAILHNWSDENCLKVLSKCYNALPQHGKVIVVEFIMPQEIQHTKVDKLITSFDNLMFLDSGVERTEKEFEKLCKCSGFSSFHVVCLAFSALGVMEFHK